MEKRLRKWMDGWMDGFSQTPHHSTETPLLSHDFDSCLTAVLPNRHFRKLRFHPVLLPSSASATKSCGTLSDNVVSKFCLPDKILWKCKYSMKEFSTPYMKDLVIKN
ncbi:hypothetical protein SRHO_G00101290 [Serrasalmus rhombeus]